MKKPNKKKVSSIRARRDTIRRLNTFWKGPNDSHEKIINRLIRRAKSGR